MSNSPPGKFLYYSRYPSVKFDRPILVDALDAVRPALSSGPQVKLSLSSSGSGSKSSDPSSQSNPFDRTDESSISSCEDSSISELEADLYYLAEGPHRGPKLVFRTSTDVFTPPSGQDVDPRVIQVLDVDHHDKLNDSWDTIRPKVVDLVDHRGILLTSCDFSRFRWDNCGMDGGVETVTSRPTIWIGVEPNSTSTSTARLSSCDILSLLKEHDIHDVDVAFRESKVLDYAGPTVLPPAGINDPLQFVTDWATTALSLPIAGLQTPGKRGALGFYFESAGRLYGVTARHVLFDGKDMDTTYVHTKCSPKKYVVLMGPRAFNEFLGHIKSHLATLDLSSGILQRQQESDAEKGDTISEQATRDKKEKTDKAAEAVRAFLSIMEKDWANEHDRIIGHVVWAPPLAACPPHKFTQDVCVIELDKNKFLQNFRGNVVDLGPEIDSGDLMRRMYPRHDVKTSFRYPTDRLFCLHGVLSLDQIKKPDTVDLNGDEVRYVLKRGPVTNTTVGRLSRFASTVRKYSDVGTFESVEAAIYPYDAHSKVFSAGGDSGALVVGSGAEFAAFLTSGAARSLTESSDITYATPMHWLWNDVIKVQYPSANLYPKLGDLNSCEGCPTIGY